MNDDCKCHGHGTLVFACRDWRKP